jgi:uncharacterized protein YqgC (DUF456 family)
MHKNIYRRIGYFVKWLGDRNPRLRTLLGVFLIVLGLIALVTPLTPGSWLTLIGLELLGFRMVFKKKRLND